MLNIRITKVNFGVKMNIFEIILLAVALSMDAFAVAICKGLATEKVQIKHMLVVGAWFGFFQALMPFIGCTIGSAFLCYIEAVDHWIAFVLLGFIGSNMIRESLCRDKCDECESADSSLSFHVMLTMAIATSIDALAAGVGMSVDLDGIGQIILAVVSIGVITFILSAIGVKIGNVFGAKYKFLAELSGGIVLVLMGLKILLEHLGVFG